VVLQSQFTMELMHTNATSRKAFNIRNFGNRVGSGLRRNDGGERGAEFYTPKIGKKRPYPFQITSSSRFASLSSRFAHFTIGQQPQCRHPAEGRDPRVVLQSQFTMELMHTNTTSRKAFSIRHFDNRVGSGLRRNDGRERSAKFYNPK